MKGPRDVVRVGGPDAASFLQGQLSQDVEPLDVGASVWSLVLQPQGKVDALVRVTRAGAEEYLLELDGGFGPSLVERLERFKLRVKADVELVEQAAAMTAGELAEYERWRVEVGFPAMGKELTESTIPEEAGVVDLTVSFTKGCYTGQELVARIDSRGRNVPRRLRRLRGSMAEGDELVADDGKVVGTVTTVAGDVGLGYVSRSVEPPATLGMIQVEALPPLTWD